MSAFQAEGDGLIPIYALHLSIIFASFKLSLQIKKEKLWSEKEKPCD